MANIFVGTSGWSYPHWKAVFYPAGLSQKNWLEHYIQHFNCVELNVTFYRLVPKDTFRDWYRRTPAHFRFVAKGPRFISHIKKLKEANAPLKRFMKNAAGLKEKLAAVLWQFPPHLQKDIRSLDTFLGLLKNFGLRQVFEFRHRSWFDREIYHLFRQHNACLCMADSDQYPCVKEVTADFIYLRFHGRGSLYGGNYTRKQLADWALVAKQFENKDIFSFFNNDAHGYAVKNALTFRELLTER